MSISMHPIHILRVGVGNTRTCTIWVATITELRVLCAVYYDVHILTTCEVYNSQLIDPSSRSRIWYLTSLPTKLAE